MDYLAHHLQTAVLEEEEESPELGEAVDVILGVLPAHNASVNEVFLTAQKQFSQFANPLHQPLLRLMPWLLPKGMAATRVLITNSSSVELKEACGPVVIIGLGNYGGGGVLIGAGQHRYDVCYKPLTFDARLLHSFEPPTSGTRWLICYFRNRGPLYERRPCSPGQKRCLRK